MNKNRYALSKQYHSRLFALIIFLLSATTMSAQVVDPLQPYILIGESGKSLSRTSKDIISRLFLLNYKVLGRHHPAGDENSEILIVTHPALRAATTMGNENAMYASISRIAIQAKGDLTYVSLQNINYWANAYYGEAYPAVDPAIRTFLGSLSGALPKYRGRFNRLYGGNRVKSLTTGKLADYRYSKRSDGIDDKVILGVYSTQHAAVTALRQVLSAGEIISKVYDLQSADRSAHLFGVALTGDVSEKVLIDLIAQPNNENYSTGFPLEILVSDGTISMLPLSYRIPLAAPGITRKNFRKLKKLQKRLNAEIGVLFQ